ncbi:hypothetical protein M0802_006357 [Mischocyttarus mexicanus]|nr:hypothetical protein M0802_006357 [Mischocyttarus mexicanus]
MRTTEVFIFLMVIYVAATARCIIKEKSHEDSDIHIIHLEDDSSNSSEDPEVIAVHIPDKRKRDVWDSKTKVFCKTDKDCDPGEKCIAYLRCSK